MFTQHQIRSIAAPLIGAALISACNDQRPPTGPMPSAHPAASAHPGSPPVLVWSPNTNGSYDFGTSDAGATSSHEFTLTNTGGASSGAVTIALSGAAAFSITADGCTGTALGSGKSCSVSVQYAQPLASQSDAATLVATSPKPTTLAATLVLNAATNPPPGHIYWSNQTTGAIGRANIDGSGVNQSFITGLDNPCAVAVDAEYIYWTELGTNSIGRAKLDGSEVNRSFITGANFGGTSSPTAVAVNTSHIYWTNYGGDAIGRANIDGTSVNQSFIASDGIHVFYTPNGLALDGTYLYWIGGWQYGRATLDGSQVDWDFYDASNPTHNSLAVDATHLYWYSGLSTAIQRANLDMQGGFEDFFIPITQYIGYITVAVDGSHIYWSGSEGVIGRANLDGTGVNNTFITGASHPAGVAVGSR